MSAQAGGKAVSARQLVGEKGIRTLYVGGLSTTLRQSSSVAVRFTCFGSIKQATCTAFRYDEKTAPVWVPPYTHCLFGLHSRVCWYRTEHVGDGV
jgi:hypothetical protein